MLQELSLTLLPTSSPMACEDCGSRQTLTERKWYDEDQDMYYNILCGIHRGLEML